MKKFTFIVSRTTHSLPVSVLGYTEEEALENLEDLILSNKVEFQEENIEDADYEFDLESVEPAYGTMQELTSGYTTIASLTQTSTNGYTPMSSLRVEEQEEDDDEDLDDDEEWLAERLQQSYVPMSAISNSPKQEENSGFLGAISLLGLVEKLANQVYKLEQKLTRNKG